MSFGALSTRSKNALSKWPELAGTGICSGEAECFQQTRSETQSI